MFKDKKKSGSILIIAMLIMVVVSGISVTIYSLGKSNQRQASSSSASGSVHNNAMNAAQFAINNLKLTPQQSASSPPSCNSTATCKAAPQGSGVIAFAWQQGVLTSTLGRTPNLVNDGENLSFWQTYAYPVPGTTTDFVLVQVNGTTTTGTLYSVVGYSNVNGNVATYSTTYYWAAYPCDCISIASQPSALPGGNLAANYGYWWANNNSATQKAGGQIAYNGGLLYIGLSESSTVTKAWIDPANGNCCDAYCRWNYKIPIVGRYIQLYLDNNTAQYLNIAEIQVFDQNNNNIALGKSASMSSAYNGGQFPASNIVNGNTNDFAHTNAQYNDWMQIDLGSDQTISQIKVYNRQDCCGDRINGAQLTVATANNSQAFNYTFSNGINTPLYTFNPPTTNVQVSNVTGRYVFLYYSSTNNPGFNIKEIQVFDGSNNNISGSASIVMSSVGSGSTGCINDGNTSNAVTTNDYKPWILMDFGSNKTISKIVIYSNGSLDHSRVGIIDGSSNSYVYQSALFFNTSAGTYTVIPQTGPTLNYATARYVSLNYFWETSANAMSTGEIQPYNGGSLLWSSANASSQNMSTGSYVTSNTYWTNNYSTSSPDTCSGNQIHSGSGNYSTGENVCNTKYGSGSCLGGYADSNSGNYYLYDNCSLVGQSKNATNYTAFQRQQQTDYTTHYYNYPTCGPNSNANDNNSGTGVCTNGEWGAWIQLDMGSNQTVTGINVYPYWGIQNAQIQLIDNNGSTIVYNSPPFFYSQGLYQMWMVTPSPTIPTAYTCTNMSGENSISVTAGSTYPRCVGYGVRTGANINGTLTVPNSYVP